MTQSAKLGNIPNETRTQFRADSNVVAQALATLNSGTTAPTQTYAGMFWWDTQTNTIKIRNGADNAWIITADWDGMNYSARVDSVAINEIATKLHVFNATAAPTVTSDSSAGYSVGSIVFATVSSVTNAYVCLSAGVGAAIWKKFSLDVFVQTTAGLVPGPTAQEVADQKVLSAAATWVTRGRARTAMAVQNISGAYSEITGIPADAVEVGFFLSNVSLVGAQDMYVQLGTTSGIEAANYVGMARSDSGSNVTFSNYFQITRGLAASELYQGLVSLHHQGANTWLLNGAVFGVGSSENHGVLSSGVKALASTMTRLRLYAGASSTFDSGSIYPFYWA